MLPGSSAVWYFSGVGKGKLLWSPPLRWVAVLLLFMGNGYVTTEVLALAIGGAAFFLLPDKLLPARGRLRSRRKEEAGQARRIQRYISRQMRDTAETFDMVAAALGEAEQRALTEKDMAQLFEDIARGRVRNANTTHIAGEAIFTVRIRRFLTL